MTQENLAEQFNNKPQASKGAGGFCHARVTEPKSAERASNVMHSKREVVNLAKLSDKQKKKIIAEYIEGSTTRALAAKYGVSQTTVRRVLQSDKETAQKVAIKKEENIKSVLAYMDSKKDSVCDLIDKLLAAMNDPAKIAATPLSQLATTMGIVIDKYTANELNKPDSDASNNLFEAIKGCVVEGDLNDIPELQQATESDSDVVE